METQITERGVNDDIDDIDDIEYDYIFIDKNNREWRRVSWSEYIKKTYNTTSIFLGIAVIYLYFLYKKPSKSASNI